MESEEPERDYHGPFETPDFFGHVGPGAGLVIFGCLWTYNTLFRYHVARRQALLKGNDQKKLNYKNSLFSIYHSGWARAVPFEPILELSIVLIICIAEAIAYNKDYPPALVFHHYIMFSSFGLMAVFEILQHYKFVVPPSLEYVGFIMANAVIAYLLTGHLHARAIVDTKMHVMLFYMAAIQIVCVLAEMMYNKSVTAALGRTLMFIAQGIWLCVMGVVIHPLPFMHEYDLHDHKLLGIVSAIPVVTVNIAIIIAVTMNAIIAVRVRNMDLATVNYIVSMIHPRRNCSGTKCDAESMLITDSDNEV